MTGRTAGTWATVAGVVGALGVTGAGVATAGGPSAYAAASKVRLKADPGGDLKFNKRRRSAAAGKVTIVMRNPSSAGIEHGIAIEGKGIDKEGKVVAPGGRSRVSATLKAGKYTYYCPVAGHKAAGMKGKLTVK